MVSIRSIWMRRRVAAQHAGASSRAQAPFGSWLLHLHSDLGHVCHQHPVRCDGNGKRLLLVDYKLNVGWGMGIGVATASRACREFTIDLHCLKLPLEYTNAPLLTALSLPQGLQFLRTGRQQRYHPYRSTFAHPRHRGAQLHSSHL